MAAKVVNPNDPMFQVRMQIISVMIQMAKVGEQMQENADDIDDKTALIFGCSMMMICQYAVISMRITDNPTVPQPIIGRRCMFY